MTSMKLIRWILLAALVFIGAIGYPVLDRHRPSLQAMPNPPVISPSPSPLSVLRLDLEKLKQTLDQGNVDDAVQQVEVGWQQQYEAYYQGKLRSRLLSTDQITQSLERIAGLTQQKTALVYVIPTPEHLEVMVLSPDHQPIHRRVQAANRTLLTQTITNFRMGITNVQSQPPDYLPAAQQLYRWIVEPVESELQTQQINTLIFCLGGGLRSVPMAALHDGQQFLVEKYRLAIIPAFNLIDQNPAFLNGTRILAMGSSEFQGKNPLPAVPAELAAIQKLWPAESWLNQDFTLEKLQERRSEYPFGIIHFATHAAFEPGSVEESYIQFWDQPLQLNRLEELNLRLPVVQLLVLSACRTALGDLNAELGFAGLAVQSGAKAALASLWSIDDLGTLVLMTNFYQQLKTSPIKAEALQQAQLALLHGQAYYHSDSVIRSISRDTLPANLEQSAHPTTLRHPYYWSGFTMIGNPW